MTAALDNGRGGYDFSASGDIDIDQNIVADGAIALQADTDNNDAANDIIEINAALLTAGLDIDMAGAVTTETDTIWASNDGDITIADNVTGDFDLTTASPNGTTSLNAVDVDQLTMTGDAAELHGNITSDDAADILSAGGLATIVNDITIDTTGNNGAVNLGDVDGANDLIVTAGTGNVDLRDGDIASLRVTSAGDTTFQGNFATLDQVDVDSQSVDIEVDGTVNAGATVNLDSTAGNLTVNGAVTGVNDVALTATRADGTPSSWKSTLRSKVRLVM